MSQDEKIPHTGDTEYLDAQIVAQIPKQTETYSKQPKKCHLPQKPTATAADPSPTNSPIMHSRLVYKDRQKNLYTKKSKNV